MHTYCTKVRYLLYVPTAVSTADYVLYVFIECCTYFLYLLQVPTDDVRTKINKSETNKQKHWQGMISFMKPSKHPNAEPGENRRSLRSGWPFRVMEDMPNMRLDS